jgi:hypothetical protein
MSGTRTFTFIPSLRQLLPATGGVPGLIYAQVSLKNLTSLQNDPTARWYKTRDAEDAYTIRGSKGEVDVILCCTGKAIPGGDPNAGARLCWLDRSILEGTGLTVGPEWEGLVEDFSTVAAPPSLAAREIPPKPKPPSGAPSAAIESILPPTPPKKAA